MIHAIQILKIPMKGSSFTASEWKLLQDEQKQSIICLRDEILIFLMTLSIPFPSKIESTKLPRVLAVCRLFKYFHNFSEGLTDKFRHVTYSNKIWLIFAFWWKPFLLCRQTNCANTTRCSRKYLPLSIDTHDALCRSWLMSLLQTSARI